MKPNKKLVVIFSVFVVSSFLFGTVVSAVSEKNPFNQLWEAIFELQSQVDEIESSSGTTRSVYDVSIDLESDGDFIEEYYQELFQRTQYTHWKIIDIPQIDFADMPIIDVYTKAPFEDRLWMGENPNWYVANGELYIQYKYVTVPDSNPADVTVQYFNSEYTIVAIK